MDRVAVSEARTDVRDMVGHGDSMIPEMTCFAFLSEVPCSFLLNLLECVLAIKYLILMFVHDIITHDDK